jgi:hypothetical protein
MKSNEPVQGRLARRQAGWSVGLVAAAGVAALTAQAALIDQWSAAGITGVFDGGEVFRWDSANGRTAWLDFSSLNAPTFWSAGTPAEGPVLRFDQALFEVDPEVNPVGGLSEFSVVAALKLNAPSATDGGAQWWEHTPFIDTDSAQAEAADWGVALRANGDVAFGAGNPDITTYSAGASAADEGFHVVIATFKAGDSLTIQLDNWDPVAAPGTVPSDPRDVLRMTLGGSTTGAPLEQLIAADIAEMRFYDTALGATESLDLANELAETHGIEFERLIHTFAAEPQEIPSGDSATLSWSAAPDATLTIEPAPGNVDDLTTDGQGQVEVTPVHDTLYTLVAVRDTTTNRLSARVTVRRSAEESLVDVWDAADAGDGAVSTWTSQQGRTASLVEGATEPTVVAGATPAGTPAVDFSQALLSVPGGDNPLGNAVEATIAYVVKVNGAPTRDAHPQWWGQTGIIDAREADGDASWGCVLNPAGQVGFGTGNPDLTFYSFGDSLVDEAFHIVVQTWGGGAMSLQVDDRDPVLSVSGVSVLPRDAIPMTFGGLATGEAEAQFAGQLAEVRFYDESLSPADIEALRTELGRKHGLTDGGPNVPPFNIIEQGLNEDGHFYVVIESVAGVNYRLLHKTALPDAEWTEVTSARAGGPTLTLTDTTALGLDGFYRVVADASDGGIEVPPYAITDQGFNGDGQFFVTFDSVAGATYRLLHKASLSDTEWAEVASAKADGVSLTLTDTTNSGPGGFYRVVADGTSGGGGDLERYSIQRMDLTDPGVVTVLVQSVSGHTYKLLKQEALGGGEWVEVDSQSAAGEQTTLTDSDAASASAFYRVLGE